MLHTPLFRVALFLLFLMGWSLQGHSQVRPGIKFGLSTPDISPDDFVVDNDQGVSYYDIFVEHARYGLHAGIFVQMQMGGFFIQPEVLFNSASIDYKVTNLLDPGVPSDIIRDNYRNLDFPLILGLKSGPVRLGGGPVGHYFLSSDGDLNNGNYPGFIPRFEDFTWGWQAGVGLDFWKLHIDLRYEGNFSKLGDHITFFGKSFNFSTNDNRLIASLGLSF